MVNIFQWSILMQYFGLRVDWEILFSFINYNILGNWVVLFFYNWNYIFFLEYSLNRIEILFNNKVGKNLWI